MDQYNFRFDMGSDYSPDQAQHHGSDAPNVLIPRADVSRSETEEAVQTACGDGEEICLIHLGVLSITACTHPSCNSH